MLVRMAGSDGALAMDSGITVSRRGSGSLGITDLRSGSLDLTGTGERSVNLTHLG